MTGAFRTYQRRGADRRAGRGQAPAGAGLAAVLGGAMLAGAVLGSAGLTGCSERDDTPAPAGQSHAPLPPPPVWARSLIGKRLTDFPSSTACLGAFDRVRLRYTDVQPGVQVEGWAWLKAEKQPPEHILLVDPGDDVVGAGETVLDRPDVPKAVPEVTLSKVGWQGVSSQTAGQMRAFAALPNGALCLLGGVDIAR